jgi:hypothetical protein
MRDHVEKREKRKKRENNLSNRIDRYSTCSRRHFVCSSDINTILFYFKQTRRVEKKTNKLLFKEERKRQEKSQRAMVVGQKIQ